MDTEQLLTEINILREERKTLVLINNEYRQAITQHRQTAIDEKSFDGENTEGQLSRDLKLWKTIEETEPIPQLSDDERYKVISRICVAFPGQKDVIMKAFECFQNENPETTPERPLVEMKQADKTNEVPNVLPPPKPPF